MYVGVGGGHIYEDVLMPPDLCEKLPSREQRNVGIAGKVSPIPLFRPSVGAKPL